MHPPRNILLVSVNWIGDVVMALPALQQFHSLHPAQSITVLAKPGLTGLWKCHAAPTAVWTLASGRTGMRDAIKRVRSGTFDCAYVLPNSFRSAWIPWRGQVPERIGLPGHWRRWLLTKTRVPVKSEDRKHQVFESYDLFLPQLMNNTWDPPVLTIPDEATAAMDRRLPALKDKETHWVAFMPGAARGPSKQWPPTHFVKLGQRIAKNKKTHILVLGTPGERMLCEEIAGAVGTGATSLAGETSFMEWLACIKACDAVVANDSGGMHVAAALGRPLVALYGITDPDVTGPLSREAVVLQKPGPRSRNVPRISRQAQDALAWITPDMVYAALLKWL